MLQEKKLYGAHPHLVQAPHHSVPVVVNVTVDVPEGQELTVPDLRKALEEVRIDLQMHLRFNLKQ